MRKWTPLLCLSACLLAQEGLGTLLGRARTARDQGRMAEAIQAYDAVLAQAPEHETALLERAQTLSWMGRFPEAAAGYLRFKQLHPRRALDADLRLAQVRAWANELPAALEVLAPWVREGQAQAVLDDATYRAWQGHLGDSLARLEAWLAIHPEDRAALMAKARFRSWTGRLKEARKDYETVLAKFPGDGEARLGLARLALWLGDPVEARTQLGKADPETRRGADGQLLEAQCAAAEGRGRAATEILKHLARGGSAQRDAQDALMENVSGNGPWVELRQSRTDTNEGLRTELPVLRARVPFLEGSAQLELGRNRLLFQDQERRSTLVGASLRQNLGSRWRVSAGLQWHSDFGGEASTAWNAGAGLRVMPGLQLQVDTARSLLDFTPAATDHRGSIRTVDLGLAWVFGDGLDAVNLGAGRGDLSVGSRRTSFFASYERRFPLSWIEFRGGLVGRGFGYSETLPLGFFNPERFRYLGLTTAATLKQARHYQLTLNLQAGTQRVNDDPSQFGWAYGVSGEWRLLDNRLGLFGAWNASKAGLPVMQTTDPEAYREHTLVFGLRWLGKAY